MFAYGQYCNIKLPPAHRRVSLDITYKEGHPKMFSEESAFKQMKSVHITLIIGSVNFEIILTCKLTAKPNRHRFSELPMCDLNFVLQVERRLYFI